MITELLKPYISERFKTEERYREGHLRVVNALPQRKVLGLHAPEMKQLAKEIHKNGCTLDSQSYNLMADSKIIYCSNGAEAIRYFELESLTESSTNIKQYTEQQDPYRLCYEETVIWGFLINLQKCSLQERLKMLERYVPVMDNWAVCDSFCANAKWMAKTNKDKLWEFLQKWFDSKKEFEVRFAIVTCMCYFLQDEWLERVFNQINTLDFERIKSEYKTVKGKPKKAQEGTVQGAEPYYVRMAVAWLLATALAKFEEQTRKFARNCNLPADVIKLYVRKARESFRTRDVSAL